MDKKQKQMIGAGIAVVVVIILIIAFSGGNTSKAGVSSITLTEKQTYAMFEAEVACELMAALGGDVEDPEFFIQTTLQVAEDAADKYGYKLSEVEANRVKYENDLEFQQLARDYALDKCPEIVSELQMDS